MKSPYVNGLSKKTAHQFLEGLPCFLEWIHSANLGDRLHCCVKKEEFKGDKSNPLYGKKLVTTGIGAKLKQVITEKLSKYGASLDTSVKNDTYMVLVEKLDEDTEKANKARKLNIPIILASNLLEKL